jgi:hypothetical protein
MDKAKEWGATALNVLSAPLFSVNRRLVIERAAALGLSSPVCLAAPPRRRSCGDLGGALSRRCPRADGRADCARPCWKNILSAQRLDSKRLFFHFGQVLVPKYHGEEAI